MWTFYGWEKSQEKNWFASGYTLGNVLWRTRRIFSCKCHSSLCRCTLFLPLFTFHPAVILRTTRGCISTLQKNSMVEFFFAKKLFTYRTFDVLRMTSGESQFSIYYSLPRRRPFHHIKFYFARMERGASASSLFLHFPTRAHNCPKYLFFVSVWINFFSLGYFYYE